MRRLLTCCTLLLAFAAPSSALAAEPGLNVQGADNGGHAEYMDMLSETGAKWSRHFLEWDRFEPAKGQIDESLLNFYKQTMAAEQARGVKTMLTVVHTPGWANGGMPNTYPPTDPKDFAKFMARIAREFAGQAEVYEIWNEEDEGIFWGGAVDAARYTGLLKEAYPAIKAVDANVSVAFGPTTGNNYGYLEQAYAAGAKGFFDAVSVHTDTACNIASPNEFYKEPNGRIGQFPFLGYREVRASMLAQGDDKPIYMSELGWSTTTTQCARGAWAGQKAAGVSEAKQAAFLAQAYHCLAADPYVQIAIWFEGKDRTANDTELGRYGLRRSDGKNKPAYKAFQEFAKGGDKLTGPCGDFSPPTIRIHSPGLNRKVFDKLVFRADTTDKDVARMTFSVDGVEVENFTPPKGSPVGTVRDYVKNPAYRNWQGVRKLPFGAHTLTVEAKDLSGNVSEQSIQFFRVDPAKLPPQKTTFQKVKLTGKGLKRSLKGKLISPGLDFGITGKVQVVWQANRKGKWKKIHGGTKNANKAFTFSQKLKFKGKWRVRLEFQGPKPYKKSATKWTQFTAK
ncbi:MAG: cellulase family glycosylhydrolase [Solirubrobacteraceae bacterium]|nr:cellulase family glycosylhydrolase [Solirubrobacteraceae bacterium]